MKPLWACGFAVFAAAAVGGCTTTRTLSVSPTNGTAPTYVEGRPWLTSAKRNTVALWLLTPAYKTQLSELLPPAFLVAVRNGGDQAIRLSRSDIIATADGRAIRLLTAEDYRSEIKRQSLQASVSVWSQQPGLGGRITLPERWVERADGQVDHLAPETILTPGVNPAPIERLLAAQQGWIDVQRDARLADADLMLPATPQAIGPGQTYTCVVRLQPSNLSGGQRLCIAVNAGDETHEFFYDVSD